MTDSRQKGATAERFVVNLVKAELGDLIDVSTVKRNLDQYQDSGCPDVIVDNLFSLEVKHYKSGRWYKDAWLKQCKDAAAKINMIPILVWRYDRMDFKATVPLYFVDRGFHFEDEENFPTEGNGIAPVTMEFDTCLMLMREWL